MFLKTLMLPVTVCSWFILNEHTVGCQSSTVDGQLCCFCSGVVRDSAGSSCVHAQLYSLMSVFLSGCANLHSSSGVNPEFVIQYNPIIINLQRICCLTTPCLAIWVNHLGFWCIALNVLAYFCLVVWLRLTYQKPKVDFHIVWMTDSQESPLIFFVLNILVTGKFKCVI